MGGVYSSVSSYVDVWKMDAFNEIDYQDDLRDQFETIRAFGRQEALTQTVRAGGFGGGPIGYGVSSKFGNNANLWLSVNSWLYDFALPFAILGAILSLWGYASTSGGLFWFGCFFFLFSFVNFFVFSQTKASKYSYKSGYFWLQLGGSILGASVALAFIPLKGETS